MAKFKYHIRQHIDLAFCGRRHARHWVRRVPDGIGWGQWWCIESDQQVDYTRVCAKCRIAHRKLHVGEKPND